MLSQMIDELLMILSVDAKGAYVFFVLVDGYPMLAGADINASSFWINNGQGNGLLFHLDN